MTTSQLIAELKRLDPSGNGEVEVPVGSYTKIYPSAYLKPYHVSQSPHGDPESDSHTVRIHVSFGQGFVIREPKR